VKATGDAAPGFELKDLGGATVKLQDVLRNGPALLAFFKISCPVCQLTFPYLQRLSTGTGLQVIGISQDEARDTASFNERYGVTFPTLLDRRADGYAASNAYGITNVPSLFLVEPDGQISMAGSGFVKRDIEALAARVGVAAFNPGERVPEFKPG
jgi:peroxiredoxin